MTTDNPASNPILPWKTGGRYVAFEARALIRKLDPYGQALLRHLAEHAGTFRSVAEVYTAIGGDGIIVLAATERTNRLAEALGYVPLIEERGSGLMVGIEAAPVVFQGLVDAQR